MRRSIWCFFLMAAVSFALALTGCLGKNTSSPGSAGVESVSLSPAANFSMDVGSTQVFSAAAKNSVGQPIIGTVQFFVTVPAGTTSPAPLSIASNGNACAGTWDAAVAVCTAGQPGIALVTAVVNGVSSAPTTVYVHLHVDNLQVVQAEPQGPQYDCFSQGQSWIYEGFAYNNGVDITSTVGQLTWSTTNAGVLTTTTYQPPNQPNVLNQVQITAGTPGITQFYAGVSGTTSTPIPIMTCLVRYIGIRAQGLSTNSINVNSGTSVPVQAYAVDSLGYTLSKVPLIFSSSNPEVVNFASAANSSGTNNASARVNLGGSDVTAACIPPTCNIGIAGYQYQDPQGGIEVLPGMPVYASDGTLPNGLPAYGAVAVNVNTTTQEPTYTAWAATDQCGNVPGCTSVIFQITPDTTSNPITASATAPRTPNSIMFNHQSRLYIGSNQGLMYMDVSAAPTVDPISGATTPCNVVLCGKVLTISNDGRQVVVSDDVSPQPQVYIYNSAATGGANPITDLVISNVATAAAFSPDQSKLFILTNAGTMYIYSTVDALAPVAIPSSGTSAVFSSDGSFAYVAGAEGSAGAVSAFSACSLPGVPSTELASVASTGVPLQIFASPDLPPPNQNVFVLEPPNVQMFTAQFTQYLTPPTQPLPAQSQLTCNPPNPPQQPFSLVAGPTYNLGQGAFTPLYARLVGDGSEFIIVGQNIPAVLVFNVASGTTTAVRLVNNAYPYAASASTDGTQLFVAACDQFQNNDPSQPCQAGSVHVVSTTGLGDHQQVPYINYTTNNMCNNLGGNAPLCVADLVALKPQ